MIQLLRSSMNHDISQKNMWYDYITIPKYNKKITIRVGEVVRLYAHDDDVIKWKYFPRYWSFVPIIRARYDVTVMISLFYIDPMGRCDVWNQGFIWKYLSMLHGFPLSKILLPIRLAIPRTQRVQNARITSQWQQKSITTMDERKHSRHG